jgi:periplasmic protein TonB
MSSQIVARHSLDIPPVANFVDSIAASTSAALRKFDERSANSTHIDLPSQTVEALEHWMHPPAQSSSLSRKGGALAIVALVHVVAVVVLAQMSPPTHETASQPLQVVSIAAPQIEEDAPPPPPQPRLPEIALPVEPMIDIATPEPTNAITVAMRPTESTPAPTRTGATSEPKMVSTVEYIREPIAKYPPAARALKQRGIVMLRALIDHTGHAREVDVHRSSGYRLLDDTARQAVLKALFKPYSENGHSIPVYVLIPIEFGAAG